MAQLPAATHSPPEAPHLESGLIDVTPTGEYVAIANSNSQDSTLLRLPAELRAMIWGHALSGYTIRPDLDNIDNDLAIDTNTKFCWQSMHRFSLLRVCRQVYTEAGILPYALSTFALTYYMSIEKWMKAASPHEAAPVRHCRRIKAATTSYTYLTDLSPLHGMFHGLETLEMHFEMPSDSIRNSKAQEKAQDKWEQYHGVIVEINFSRSCDYYSQWATGDPTARCKACVDGEIRLGRRAA